ncbi:MAG: aminoacyl-tRNA hydrolase [Candidatus Magasanikbacteria bacterium]|jgi:peptidyl-tRNA hydrolase, PTH1 family|nr:aminoacyl-tRNA hydrolase [Candidatus Magasanikbacteria bacterium]MBT4314612.1 aminoacyl-tRNA hydrolase [Candidatus Magasanikbacteria bacterium]MBT4547033.1 aminoacyl-tRNA hydrolase [Candidatus Magasanikbacteria bacterium]MBT6819493.1 aminoacyl-tRNA hydrolase [Candidatus Magasanikbacteria bacterium]
MKLIVGLGNPGKRYEKTRHNVGFMILDKLREKLGSSGWSLSKKFNSETSGLTLNGEKVILAKPMTFMNASGQSVQLIAHFYKVAPEDIIVVHDDKDLKLGDVRVQEDRSHAGHNGIKSIIEHIGTQKFTRVRVGVASENEKKMRDTAKFVLHKFGYFEKKKVEEIVNKSIEEIKKML